MGGSFGAKTFVRTEAIVAALARKAGRPVNIVLDRDEEFLTLNRHPATIRVRLGARATAPSSPASSSAGSTPAPTPTAARASRRRSASPPSARTASPTSRSTRCCVYTNLPPNGAYRGYGATQAIWASERTLDLLADGSASTRSSCA